MSGHRRNKKEMQSDQRKSVGGMAEQELTRNATDWMRTKPYSKHTKAGELVKAQGKQIETIDMLEYLRRKHIVKGNR